MRRRRVWLFKKKVEEQNNVRNFHLRNRVAGLHRVQGMHILRLNLPQKMFATSSNTAKTTRPETGMSSETRVPASRTNVPRKFEFSRSAEPKHILDEDWDDAYYASERWEEEWVVTQDPDRPEWQFGFKIYEHKMYW